MTRVRSEMTGAELREIRKRLRLTQVKFAARLGVASNHLAMSERGEKYIGRTVALFARELDRKGGRR